MLKNSVNMRRRSCYVYLSSKISMALSDLQLHNPGSTHNDLPLWNSKRKKIVWCSQRDGGICLAQASQIIQYCRWHTGFDDDTIHCAFLLRFACLMPFI
ncbi:hypothetical protein AC1031_018310 [Aphanomyces cochlioides]|nr:hypothetical protein AC1031_018310 [Aphanomyces cochlioides]